MAWDVLELEKQFIKNIKENEDDLRKLKDFETFSSWVLAALQTKKELEWLSSNFTANGVEAIVNCPLDGRKYLIQITPIIEEIKGA